MGRTARINFTKNGTFIAPAGVTYIKAVMQQKLEPVIFGYNNNGFIGVDNNAYMFGANGSGEDGNGGTSQINAPALVSGGIQFRKIINSAGSSEICSMGIDSIGRLWVWGTNTYGQQGNGGTSPSSIPVLVSDGPWSDFNIGRGCTAFGIDSYGTPWGWGFNTAGQVGIGSNTSPILVPTRLAGTLPVIQKIISSFVNGYALAKNGALYAWGDNTHGQLGVGDNVNRTSPTLVLGGHVFADVFSDLTEGSMFGLDIGGTLYAWGYNDATGVLGVGTTSPVNTPTLVSGGHLFSTMAVAPSPVGGGTHCLAIGLDGNLYSWGRNDQGQLGDGTITNRISPVLVQGLPGGKTWIAVHAHTQYASFALASDGSLYAWGWNTDGVLGTGSAGAYSPAPTIVSGGYNFIKIFPGRLNSLDMCALRNDGILMTWGNGTNGQLGNSGTSNSNVPVVVFGLPVQSYNPQSILEIPVVPGQSYPINILQPMAMFGNIALGANINNLIVEFEQ